MPIRAAKQQTSQASSPLCRLHYQIVIAGHHFPDYFDERNACEGFGFNIYSAGIGLASKALEVFSLLPKYGGLQVWKVTIQFSLNRDDGDFRLVCPRKANRTPERRLGGGRRVRDKQNILESLHTRLQVTMDVSKLCTNCESFIGGQPEIPPLNDAGHYYFALGT
jgi:hypothetical protein